MRPGVMLGSWVCVVSRRWVRLVVWRLVCVASAGYLRCACWCGCVDGGGLSAFLPVESVPALGGCLCAVCAVVCGGGGGVRCAGRLVGAVGCECACGVYLVWAVRSLRAVGVLLPCLWQIVLSDCAWLVYALRAWCWCGSLGLRAGCGCVACAVWSGVMVGSLTCVAGWWQVWSGRYWLGGGGGCGWTAWWLWCRWAALMMGLGCVVAGGRVWRW